MPAHWAKCHLLNSPLLNCPLLSSSAGRLDNMGWVETRQSRQVTLLGTNGRGGWQDNTAAGSNESQWVQAQ